MLFGIILLFSLFLALPDIQAIEDIMTDLLLGGTGALQEAGLLLAGIFRCIVLLGQ